MSTIMDCLLDALIDSVKLLPFLFVTYVLMEYIEHKMGEKAKLTIQKAGASGPLLGALLGVTPQCGFSTVAANLYAGRIITLGTLFAVFLSTSDEMLPIFISESVPISTILKILGCKCLIALLAGFLIDLCLKLVKKAPKEEMMDGHLCEHEHCHCEQGIFKSATIHTVKIWSFLFVISLVLNLVLSFVSEETITALIGTNPILSGLVAGLVGLVPNCGASVVITELYLKGMIPVGAMFSGLLVGAGVGLLVLFRVNDHRMENLKITGLLYLIGVTAGMVMEGIVSVFGWVI